MVVAQDGLAPKSIVDVGAYTGEFLEAFMERFPTAHGRWNEPYDLHIVRARKRLARFGNNVDYFIGCPERDIAAEACIPDGADVVMTSWLSVFRDAPGMVKFYAGAAARMPSGGWIASLDHVRVGSPWQARLEQARVEALRTGIAPKREGPPIRYKHFAVATLEDQLAAMKAAGIDDPQVVWRRLDTVLIMGRKK